MTRVEVGGRLEIGGELDPAAIGRHRRLAAQGLEAALEVLVLLPPPLVAGEHRRRRIQDDGAAEAVDHPQVAGARVPHEPPHPDHRRHALGARHDRRVRGHAAHLDREARHPGAIEERRLRGRDVVPGQHSPSV